MKTVERDGCSKNHKSQLWRLNSLTKQIFVAFILALIVGIGLRTSGLSLENISLIAGNLAIPADLVINALKALAYPLVFVILINTFVSTNIVAKQVRQMAVILLTNSAIGVLLGVLVCHIIQPGAKVGLVRATAQNISKPAGSIIEFLNRLIPPSLLQPLVENDVIPMIVIAICLGIAVRAIKETQITYNQSDYLPFVQIIESLTNIIIRILKWVIALLPIAVFGLVVKAFANQGFEVFQPLSWYIIVTLLAFFLQACYYLIRLQFNSWVKPQDFLQKGKDAFLTAFSTSSGIATSEVTYKSLQQIGLQESFAKLAAFIFVNLNKDATALNLATSALFISQYTGQNLDEAKISIVILTSILASIITVGVPNGGTAGVILVFSAAGLDVNYFFALLLPIDWFLDMFRTVVNVMGNMSTAALLEGRKTVKVNL